MAGYSEYRNEQFIQQYEHITKMKLLTNEELGHVKKKRNLFEIGIRSANEVKPFIDYIKYEIALMSKFKQIDYKNDSDGRALNAVMALHVKGLFRLALKKFQDKRRIWDHYLEFAKQTFPKSVTSIYQDMLRYHHETSDYIEAARHEISKNNFTTAIPILMQGIGIHKDSKSLVVMFIECSIKQGEKQDENVQKATLLQASKFYEKFFKNSDEIESICELLRTIQVYSYSLSFQNTMLTDLMAEHAGRAEVWEIFASRHLDGLVYSSAATELSPKETTILPFDIRLRQTITIYETSLESVSKDNKKKMFAFFINRLLELDEKKDISLTCLKFIRQSLGKTLAKGFEQSCLSEQHFIVFLQLRMLNIDSNENKIVKMLKEGIDLYPSSMYLYELSIKFYLKTNSHEKVTEIFKKSISSNPKCTIELYRFLCEIYLNDSAGKDKARSLMLEAINNGNNPKLSQAFQPFFLEYLGLSEGIEKAREAFNLLIKTKTMDSLSLDFFKMMIKLEEAEEKPNHKLIANCYQR